MTSVELNPSVVQVNSSAPPVTVAVNGSPVTVDLSDPIMSVAVAPQLVSVNLSQIGIPGPTGSAPLLSAVTTQPISGHCAVTLNNAGQMVYATANDMTYLARPIAITTGAWAGGVNAQAQLAGIVIEVSWNWTVGVPIWLGDNGLLTQSLPGDAVFQRQLAEVITPQSIWVDVQQAVVLA